MGILEAKNYKTPLLFLLLLVSISRSEFCMPDNIITTYVRIKYGIQQSTSCIKMSESIQNCQLYLCSACSSDPTYQLLTRSQFSCLYYADQDQNNCQRVDLSSGGGVVCLQYKKMIKYCRYYKKIQGTDDQYECAACLWPYKLASNSKTCFYQDQNIKNYNCDSVNQANQCVKCSQNYIKIGKSCIPQTRVNCQNFNQMTYKCQQCLFGYKLTSSFGCQLISDSGKQTKCGANQFLAQNSKCSPIFPYCKQYYYNGTCQTCQYSYQFTDDFSQCKYKKPIQPGDDQYETCQNTDQIDNPRMNYWKIEGICKGIDANCADGKFSGSGCYLCKDTFFLYNSLCFAIVPNN